MTVAGGIYNIQRRRQGRRSEEKRRVEADGYH